MTTEQLAVLLVQALDQAIKGSVDGDNPALSSLCNYLEENKLHEACQQLRTLFELPDTLRSGIAFYRDQLFDVRAMFLYTNNQSDERNAACAFTIEEMLNALNIPYQPASEWLREKRLQVALVEREKYLSQHQLVMEFQSDWTVGPNPNVEVTSHENDDLTCWWRVGVVPTENMGGIFAVLFRPFTTDVESAYFS